MILRIDLERTTRSYLRAARALNRRSINSHDAAFYLCGYAVEIALKARVCQTLGWTSYPETSSEFASYRSFRTHDLGVLLHLTGNRIEDRVRLTPGLLAAWSVVEKWRPEQRYQPVGTRSPSDATNMVQATSAIIKVLI